MINLLWNGITAIAISASLYQVLCHIKDRRSLKDNDEAM